MKKAAAVLLAVIFTLALCACGDGDTGASSAEVSSAESTAVSSMADTAKAVSASSEASSAESSGPAREYLKAEPGSGKAQSAAIAAYN